MGDSPSWMTSPSDERMFIRMGKDDARRDLANVLNLLVSAHPDDASYLQAIDDVAASMNLKAKTVVTYSA